jgi:hypothetical protein
MEKSESTKRAGTTHQQSKHVPGKAQLQGQHYNLWFLKKNSLTILHQMQIFWILFFQVFECQIIKSGAKCRKLPEKTQMEGGSIYLPGIGENAELVMTTDIRHRLVQVSVAASLWSWKYVWSSVLTNHNAYVLEENNKAIKWKRKHRL